MADYQFDPQSEFALFAEDARIGRLQMYGQRRPKTCRFDRDTAVPVFHVEGEIAVLIAPEDVAYGLEMAAAGKLHLPYSECVFMYYVPPDFIGSLNNKQYSTVWIVWAQESQEGITGTLFYRHPQKMRAYGLNNAQFTIREADIQIANDPAATWDREQMDILEMSTHARALSLLAHTALMALPHAGTATVEPANKATTDANVRRARINLPPLSRVRTIHLHPPEERVDAGHQGRGKGVPKSPHWTRGYYRKTGRWVAAYATGNLRGKDLPPPWYNVKEG